MGAERGISVVAQQQIGDRQQIFYAQQWAVIIGIDSYPGAPLQYAVRDARAMEAVLLRMGFAKERIITLFDREATKKNILDILTKQLSTRLKPEDGLVVFFAGHGITSELHGQTVGYWVPIDADTSRSDSCISMLLLSEAVNQLPCKHVLVLVDCCYSGFALQRSQPLSSDTKGYLNVITNKPARQR